MKAIHGGKAKNDRSIPKRWRRCCVAACSRRPLALLPPCGPRATCSDAVCLWPTNGPSSWHTSTIPIASITLPAIGKKLAYQATSRRGRRALCRSGGAQEYRGRSGAHHLRRCAADATSNAPSSQPPGTMMPIPCLCSTPCPASARGSASCCSTTIHDLARFPRVQDCLSSCRLVTGARESAGTRDRDLRDHNRPGPSHMGLFCSRCLVLERPSGSPAIPRPLGEKTRQGDSLDSPGPAAGPRRL